MYWLGGGGVQYKRDNIRVLIPLSLSCTRHDGNDDNYAHDGDDDPRKVARISSSTNWYV